jgi:SAM-dependent methyltransferase
MNTGANGNGQLYFYAGDDVRFYDVTAESTDRAYQLMQTCSVEILSRWLLARGSDPLVSSAWVMDIGCGTGAATMQILASVPLCKIICVDSSADMLGQLRQKVENAYGSISAGGRVFYACEDFRRSGWLDASFKGIDSRIRPTQLDAALSIYALHHLLPDEKLQVYRAIYTSLKPRGMFVLGDLFAFATEWLSSWAQQSEEDWLTQEFDSIPQAKPWLEAILGPHRERLKEAWLAHVRNDNRPLAIQPTGNDASELGQSEIELLSQAGFIGLETAFRIWQSAILIANV